MNRNNGRTIGTRLVLLRDYLYSHADANHAVSIKDMMTYLANCGFEVAIKTVYSDLHALNIDFGVELEYSEKLKGYILKNPPFESYELRLLIDSVQASKFITQTKAQDTLKLHGNALGMSLPSRLLHLLPAEKPQIPRTRCAASKPLQDAAF